MDFSVSVVGIDEDFLHGLPDVQKHARAVDYENETRISAQIIREINM